MALKALMLRKKIDSKKEELGALREKDADFVKREAELEAAIAEAETQEEKDAVDSEIEKFEEEKKDHAEQKSNLEKEVSEMEEDLAKEEAEQRTLLNPKKEERKEERKVNTRGKFFGMAAQERDAFFVREDVKDFLQRARELAKQKRAVNGAELLIPTVVLDLVKENISLFSKLYKHVNARPVPGKARQNVMGTIPEGVWTEMCAKLNELNLVFTAVEVDGYKVGGYIAICILILHLQQRSFLRLDRQSVLHWIRRSFTEQEQRCRLVLLPDSPRKHSRKVILRMRESGKICTAPIFLQLPGKRMWHCLKRWLKRLVPQKVYIAVVKNSGL